MGACVFTVMYSRACLHLPSMKCSGLVNVEVKKKMCERSQARGLTNPKTLPPPLIVNSLNHNVLLIVYVQWSTPLCPWFNIVYKAII